MGLRSLFQFITNPDNALGYISILLPLGLISISGFLLISVFFPRKNLFFKIGAGAIFANILTILLFSTIGYVLKGEQLIIFCLAALLFGSGLVSLFKFKNFNDSEKLFNKNSVSLSSFIQFIIFILLIIVLILLSGNAIYGGDATTYWGLSTSIANGNYPTYLPWQPDHLSTYRQGAFVIMGLIQGFSNAGISVIHTLYSSYLLTVLCALLIGITIEIKRHTVLWLLPILVGLLISGGPLLLTSSPLSFTNLLHTSLSQPISEFATLLPKFDHIRGSAGSGADSVESLIYSNFTLLGFSILVLGIYLLLFVKNNKYKYLLLALINISLLSVDESLWPALTVCIGMEIISTFIKTRNLGSIIRSTTLFSVPFIILFFVIQNPIRDSLYTPSPHGSRFSLVEYKSSVWVERLNYISSVKMNVSGQIWFLPNLALIIFLTGILAYYSHSSMAKYFVLSSFVLFILGIFIQNTYWSANGLRFITYSHRLNMLSIGFSLYYLFTFRDKFKKIAFILIFALLIPQLLVEIAWLYKKITVKEYHNLTRSLKLTDEIQIWAKNNLPYNARIVFLDEYPDQFVYSPVNLTGIEKYGLFIPSVPPYPKALNAEFGGEIFDAIWTASPKSLSILKIEYVIIKETSFNRLSPNTTQLFSDSSKTKLIKKVGVWDVYQIQRAYYDSPDNEITLLSITDNIEIEDTVFIGKFIYPDVRRYFLNRLSLTNKLIGPNYSIGGDWFMYLERDLPTILELPFHEAKWLIVSPEFKETNSLSGYKLIRSSKYVELWQKK